LSDVEDFAIGFKQEYSKVFAFGMAYQSVFPVKH